MAVVKVQAIPTLALAAQVSPVPSDDMVFDPCNPRGANVILLGSLSHYLDIPAQVWRDAIGERVPPKERQLNPLAPTCPFHFGEPWYNRATMDVIHLHSDPEMSRQRGCST